MIEEELEILNVLADAWNKYLDLPVQLTNDRVEFMMIIHDAQRMILCRAGLRDLEMREL